MDPGFAPLRAHRRCVGHDCTAAKQKARHFCRAFRISCRAETYDSACFTRSGENGTRLIRTPVASKIALAMAAATGRIDGSPAPDRRRCPDG